MRLRLVSVIARFEASRLFTGFGLVTTTLPLAGAAVIAGMTDTSLAALPALGFLSGAIATWRALRDGTVGTLLTEPVTPGETFGGVWLGAALAGALVAAAAGIAGALAAGESVGRAGLAALLFVAASFQGSMIAAASGDRHLANAPRRTP